MNKIIIVTSKDISYLLPTIKNKAKLISILSDTKIPNLDTELISSKKFLYNRLKQSKPDLILLIGYDKTISNQIISVYGSKVIELQIGTRNNFNGLEEEKIHKWILKHKIDSHGVRLRKIGYEYEDYEEISRLEFFIQNSDTIETLKAKIKDCEEQILSDFLT